MGWKDLFSKKTPKEKQEKLDSGLEKTKQSVWSKLTRAIGGKSKVDEEVLDNLEEALISSDVGVDTTVKIIQKLEERVARDKFINTNELSQFLCEEICEMLAKPANESLMEDFQVPTKGVEPYVILVVGVNGVGKTTTIGKLAYQYTKAGNKVVIGAGDTYRAAAIDQLEVWAQRANVTIIKQEMRSDPASVAYDTVAHAKKVGADVVIIDTAGRLHNKINLMNELSKMKRVMQKILPNAPQEVLLVLDGATGQNAVEQARQFSKATDVTSLAITKLDGTAKGGVVLNISDEFNIPVKYIGLGEKIDDLQIFRPVEFVKTLFGEALE